MENNLDKQYQTLLVLWFALLMSIVMYFIVTLVAAPEISREPGNPPNSVLIVGLTALGTILVVASFLVRRRFLEWAVDKQDTSLVKKGLMFSCAMCEVSALLGLLERFLIGNREYYLLFVVAAVGIASHFPRRRHLEAASYKSRSIVD